MDGLSIHKLPTGALQLRINAEGRAELQDIVSRATHLDHSVLADMLERDAANGRYHPIDPDYIFVGLTSAPCICDAMDYSNDADPPLAVGNVWWFPDYAVRSFAEVLLAEGEVTFPLGSKREEPVICRH